jgi:putative ABC transport system permease protein
MFNRDHWQELFDTIRRNKWRTIATAFGVFWGILMLVLLMGAGQGLQNGVVSNMTLDATNSIWFFTDRTSVPYRGLSPGREIDFTEDDLAFIKENVEGVEYVAPENWLSGNFNIIHKQKSSPFMVLGVGKDYFNIKIYQQYTAGRKLNSLDNYEDRKVCVVGDRVTEVLFEPGEDPIGKDIIIKGVAFKIVGIFHDEGWGGRFGERVYIPFGTFQQTFNPDKFINLFAITTLPGHSGKVLEENVLSILKERHLVHPDDNQAFWTHNQEENYKNVMGLFFGIKSFIWLVGIGTLLAGVVGVSNIMLIVVKERTREIGVRKALGASPGSIVSMIVFEAILITAIAGYFGLLAGVGLVYGLDSIMAISGAEAEYFKDPTVNFQVAFAALFILVIAGTLAGLFPAMRAAQINPVEALRSE